MQMEEENICRLVQLPIGANARCRLFNFLIFGHRTETRKDRGSNTIRAFVRNISARGYARG